MKTYEHIEDIKRPIIVYNYKTGEIVGEYESLTHGARELYNNPQRLVYLSNIARGTAKSAKCDKLGIRITVKYKS